MRSGEDEVKIGKIFGLSSLSGEVERRIVAICPSGTYVLFDMKTLVFLSAVLLLVSATGAVKAQNDYPVPPGNPSDWGIPGRPEELSPAPQQTAPANAFSTLPPPGNEGLNQPSVPAGEPQEEYTGTGNLGFGGVAGTGIEPPDAPASPQSTFRR